MSTRFFVALATALVGGAAVLPACNAAILDLGQNAPLDGSVGPTLSNEDAGILAAKAGCSEWIDEDVQAANANECDGSCSVAPEDPTFPFPTMKRFVDLTGGAWLRCAGAPFGPTDTIGVELAPGCRLYFLHYDADGKVSRGTEIRHQGVMGIYDPPTRTDLRRIDIKTTEGTKSYDAYVTRCPKALVLTPVGQDLPGRATMPIVLRPARETDGGTLGTFPR